MKGFLKGMCITAAALMMVGIVFVIGGTAMGGTLTGLELNQNGVHFRDFRGHNYNFDWNNGRRNRNPSSIYTYNHRLENRDMQGFSDTVSPTDNITSLDFELGDANVNIETGSEFNISCNNSYEYNSRVENGKWIVVPGVHHSVNIGRHNTSITITIPENSEFDDIDISMGAGKISLGKITAKACSLELGAVEMTASDFICTGDADISVGAATLTLSGELRGKTYLEVGMGSAELKIVKAPNYGFNLDMGLGAVEIFDKSYVGIAEASENTDAQQFFDIECGMGNVKIKEI